MEQQDGPAENPEGGDGGGEEAPRKSAAQKGEEVAKEIVQKAVEARGSTAARRSTAARGSKAARASTAKASTPQSDEAMAKEAVEEVVEAGVALGGRVSVAALEARESLQSRESITIDTTAPPGVALVKAAVEAAIVGSGLGMEVTEIAKAEVEAALEAGGLMEDRGVEIAKAAVEGALTAGGLGEDSLAIAKAAVEAAVAAALGERGPEGSVAAAVRESVEKVVSAAVARRPSAEKATRAVVDAVVTAAMGRGDSIEQMAPILELDAVQQVLEEVLPKDTVQKRFDWGRSRYEEEERVITVEWKYEEDEMRIKERPRKRSMGGIHQVPWTPTKRRGPIAAEYQSPGPACVNLPNLIGGTIVPDSKRNRAPAFSFGSRHGGKSDSPGPGPGQYNVTGLSAKGKDNPPAASLHSRPKDCKEFQTPAPGDYNPEKSEKVVHDNSPKYTFGLKTQHEKPSTTPAPNVYNIPTVLGATKEGNKKQAPAFTISGRQKDKPDDRIYNPGPGSYNDAKADNYKLKSPAYSISSRYQLPSDSTLKPGPGAHSPEKVYANLRWAPNYSFGIKHSKYKGDRGYKLLQECQQRKCTCTC